jgi:hypothetical protein
LIVYFEKGLLHKKQAFFIYTPFHCKVFAVAFFGRNLDIGYLCKVQIQPSERNYFFARLFPSLQR